MDQLKSPSGWRKWFSSLPLLASLIKPSIDAEILFFKRLAWKDRVQIAGLYLLFWGGLLSGIWQVALGFYEGPNFAATRIVVVDYIAEWTEEGRHNTRFTHWSLEYHYVSSKGETVSRRITVNSDDPGARQVRDAEVGDELLLRVGVPAGEPGAAFGFNKAVRQGMAIVLLLLVLWYFSRDGFLAIDEETGKVVPDKTKVIKLLVAFFGTMFGMLWLTSPVIP